VSAPGTGPIRFGVVGSGWRTNFFLRVAQALPDRFQVAGLSTRNPETGTSISHEWGIPTYRSVQDLVQAEQPAFVVVSVPRNVAPDVITDAVRAGAAVLTETPPAADVPGLLPLHDLVGDGARIQVAEQYHLQPLLAAQIAVARSGRLGEVTLAEVSTAHDYHGISLIRRILGIGFEDARITATDFQAPITAGPTRLGEPDVEQVRTETQTLAQLDFGGRVGVYDWSSEEYYSWIRSRSVLVRGTRGEIRNDELKYLQDFRTPLQTTIRRINAGENGNLQGYYLKGLVAGDSWLYRNPYAPARLLDDELALAALLERMGAYVDGGPEVYSLAEASQDHYLQLMVRQAAETGSPVQTTRQPWAS
jgi:predicted dehydrogenase